MCRAPCIYYQSFNTIHRAVKYILNILRFLLLHATHLSPLIYLQCNENYENICSFRFLIESIQKLPIKYHRFVSYPSNKITSLVASTSLCAHPSDDRSTYWLDPSHSVSLYHKGLPSYPPPPPTTDSTFISCCQQ